MSRAGLPKKIFSVEVQRVGGHLETYGCRSDCFDPSHPSRNLAMPEFIRPPALSPRQEQLCSLIERLTAANGYPPSLREVSAAMNVHHTRVAQLAVTTQAKGYLTRTPGIARSWRVVRPDTSKATSKRGR